MQPETSKEVLEQAFALFNQHSTQLETSYQTLQQRVAELNDELARANGERLRQLKDKERLADRLERLLGALPGGVLVLDGDGRISDCNQAAVDMLGEPLMNRYWRGVLQRAGVFNDQGELELLNGQRLSISKRTLRAEPGHILLLSDVTEPRRMQAMLARNQRLVEMGEMAARLAHQVRTPLSSALLYASQVARPTLDQPRRQRYASRIDTRLQQVERMVNDMLEFARGGRRSDDVIDVTELLRDVAQMIEPQKRPGDQIIVEVAATVGPLAGNREALAGALANLCNNALQAAAPGVRVTLSARTVGSQQIELAVRDDGPGMAAAQAAQVFEPFFTTRSDGTGLGLAVVKSTAQAHGGDVTLISAPGSGCDVRMRINNTLTDVALAAQCHNDAPTQVACA